MSRKTKFSIYKDAAVARLHNRRIVLRRFRDDGYTLHFFNAYHPNKYPNPQPGPAPKFIRGKIHFTELRISEEALDALLVAYVKLKQRGPIIEPNNSSNEKGV